MCSSRARLLPCSKLPIYVYTGTGTWYTGTYIGHCTTVVEGQQLYCTYWDYPPVELKVLTEFETVDSVPAVLEENTVRSDREVATLWRVRLSACANPRQRVAHVAWDALDGLSVSCETAKNLFNRIEYS